TGSGIDWANATHGPKVEDDRIGCRTSPVHETRSAAPRNQFQSRIDLETDDRHNLVERLGQDHRGGGRTVLFQERAAVRAECVRLISWRNRRSRQDPARTETLHERRYVRAHGNAKVAVVFKANAASGRVEVAQGRILVGGSRAAREPLKRSWIGSSSHSTW